MLKKINISTKKDDIFEITSDVKKIVEESGVSNWCLKSIVEESGVKEGSGGLLHPSDHQIHPDPCGK